MGVNNWTAAQWRAYNRSHPGDRHVNRALRPVPQWEALKEDLAQERALRKLEHRHCVESWVDAYKRREMAFIRLTQPLTFMQTGEDADD